MDLSKKKCKITQDKFGNEIKNYKLTEKEMKEYLKKINRGKKENVNT